MATESKIRAVERYNEKNYERFTVRVKKGRKAEIDNYAKSCNMSTNAFINAAIDEIMENANMNDTKIETIEVIEYLKNKYPERLNKNIVSVEFSQTAKDVFVRITRKTDTNLGVKYERETINLDFIADDDGASIEELSYGVAQTYQAFSPDANIEENAKNFVDDENTLENTMPLFY